MLLYNIIYIFMTLLCTGCKVHHLEVELLGLVNVGVGSLSSSLLGIGSQTSTIAGVSRGTSVGSSGYVGGVVLLGGGSDPTV